MSEFDEKEDQRDYPREVIDTPTTILIDGQWHQCLIVNISSSGAKLYIGRKISRNMLVSIKIGDFGEFKAAIIWFQGDEVGVKFGHTPAEMSPVLKALLPNE
jgi:hypothetical protein